MRLRNIVAIFAFAFLFGSIVYVVFISDGSDSARKKSISSSPGSRSNGIFYPFVSNDAGFDHPVALEITSRDILFELSPDIPIETLRVSPDGQHIAYLQRIPGQAGFMAKLDGVLVATLTGLEETGFVFSPNSQRLAFGIESGSSRFMVVDGNRLGPYESATWPRFSEDSRRYAFVETVEEKLRVVVDGSPSPLVEQLDPENILFDANGVAIFSSADNENNFVYYGDKVVAIYERIGSLVLDTDRRQLAYAASDGDGSFVEVVSIDWLGMLDRRRDHSYDKVFSGLLFSPRGDQCGYVAQDGHRYLAIINGVVMKGPPPLAPPVFWDTPIRYAYPVELEGGKVAMLVDGQVGKFYDSLKWGTRFLPDGTLIYAAQRGESVFMIHDGAEGPAFDFIDLANMFVHSPDGSSFCYGAISDGRSVIVVNREIRHTAEAISDMLVSSPRQGLWACWSMENERWRLVINGSVCGSFDGYFGGDFVEEGIFVGTVRQGEKIVRLTVAITPDTP